MNTLIVSGSMALLAIVGLIYFKYRDSHPVPPDLQSGGSEYKHL